MSPKQHLENLPGIEKFESVVRQIPGLNHTHRGYHTQRRTSREGPRVRIDLREHTLLLKCGNTEGWQELYATLPQNVDLNEVIARALILFPEHGIAVSRQNIISLREKGVDLKTVQKRREEILQKRDEARKEAKRKEKEKEELTVTAALRRLGVPTTPQTAEGKPVEETSPEETQPTETQELHNVPREEWPIVWPFLQEHARKEGSPTEGGWIVPKAFSILRDHPDIRMRKECAGRFLAEAKARGLVRRESNSFSWFISEKDWFETAKQETVPDKPAAPPLSQAQREELTEVYDFHLKLLMDVIASLEKGEDPIQFLQETIPLNGKQTNEGSSREQVREHAQTFIRRIERARDLICTHVTMRTEYARQMQAIVRGEDLNAAEEPSGKDSAGLEPIIR